MEWTLLRRLRVGDRYQHPLGRTVIQTDNSWFTLLTQNTSPVHFDVHHAAKPSSAIRSSIQRSP